MYIIFSKEEEEYASADDGGSHDKDSEESRANTTGADSQSHMDSTQPDGMYTDSEPEQKVFCHYYNILYFRTQNLSKKVHPL